MLTQNTAWRNVEKAILNLKKANSLSPQKILEIDEKKLQELIRPSGFYRQKAIRLKLATAKWLELKEKAKSMDRFALRKEWLSVKGIGKETADSIILYAHNKPIFVIDSYTKRFCKAFNLFEAKEYDEYREFFEKNLPKRNALEIYKEYHALIVRWGKEKKRKG